MPELPEVEIFKRHFDATSRRRRISGVSVRDRRIIGNSSPRRLVARLKGAGLGRSRRHGKYLFLGLGKAGWLVMHFGMNGSLRHFHSDADDPPYDRLRLDLGNDHHLAYVNPRLFGRVELVRDADDFMARDMLAPDALDARLGLAGFVHAVAGKKGAIKLVLMDRTVISGIGNIYSDEILFQARPTLAARMRTRAAYPLTRARAKRLAMPLSAETVRAYQALRERNRPRVYRIADRLTTRHGDGALPFARRRLESLDRYSRDVIHAKQRDEDAIDRAIAGYWWWAWVVDAVAELQQREGRA